MKECDGCTLCCDLIAVPALKKEAGQACTHCLVRVGCQVYDARPEQCRGFECLWLSEPSLPEDLWPAECGVFFEPFWDERMVVASVDPLRPNAWREGAPSKLIRQMIEDGYIVWVMNGPDRNLVLPPGATEKDGHDRAKRAWSRKWQHQPTPQT